MEEGNNISLPSQPILRHHNTCLRVCLVASSIILWIGGAFFFLLGVFAYNFLKNFFTEGRGLKYAAGFPIASITFGIVTILVVFLLNYFIIFSSKVRYYMMSGVLAIIFIFELVYFLAGVDYGARVERVVNKAFQTAMLNYRDGFALNIELNLVQWLLKCCGAKNYRDWFETSWANGRMEVPESCCINLRQCHNLEPVMVDDIYLKGCEEKLRRFIKMYMAALITLVILSVVTLIVGVLLTLILGVREDNKVQPTQRRRRRPPEEPLISNS